MPGRAAALQGKSTRAMPSWVQPATSATSSGGGETRTGKELTARTIHETHGHNLSHNLSHAAKQMSEPVGDTSLALDYASTLGP